jgi:hypothetical protein
MSRIRGVGRSDQVSFKTDRAVCRKVGKLVHDAVRDPRHRNNLKANAKSLLAGAGIDPKELDARPPEVIEDSDKKFHVVLPHEVKDRKDFATQKDFDEYLDEIGFVSIMGCR